MSDDLLVRCVAVNHHDVRNPETSGCCLQPQFGIDANVRALPPVPQPDSQSGLPCGVIFLAQISLHNFAVHELAVRPPECMQVLIERNEGRAHRLVPFRLTSSYSRAVCNHNKAEARLLESEFPQFT